ncbi:fumarate hydratase C-terminal domain-containing protein [Chloroflexota bacterium]
MTTKQLTTPLTEEVVRSLSVNDEVTLSGTIFTCRSQFLIRAIEQCILPPIDFSQVNAMFHMGGIMRLVGQQWSPVSLLATSSYRFNKLTPGIISKLGLRAIIGKGTMGNETMASMAEFGCVHLSWGAVMGNALASQVNKVMNVYDLDVLGPTEATWVLKVEDFGPFVVDIDTDGNNLFREVGKRVAANLESVYQKYGISAFSYTSADQ